MRESKHECEVCVCVRREEKGWVGGWWGCHLPDFEKDVCVYVCVGEGEYGCVCVLTPAGHSAAVSVLCFGAIFGGLWILGSRVLASWYQRSWCSLIATN